MNSTYIAPYKVTVTIKATGIRLTLVLFAFCIFKSKVQCFFFFNFFEPPSS